MKPSTTARRTRKGYFILAALIAFGLLVFYSDRIAEAFHGHMDVVALVERTQGVRVGSPVYVQGVEVGRVMDVGFATVGARGAVALDLRIQERAQELVRRGSAAHTARQRFVGAPILRISAGPADAPPVQPGDTLMPAGLPTPEALLSQSRELPGALDSLAMAVRRIQELAGDRSGALTAFTDRLPLIAAEFSMLRRELDAAELARWLEDPTLNRRIERLREHADSLGTALAGLDRYTEHGELSSGAEALVARADRLAAALDSLQSTLVSGDGILPRARRDSALAVAVERVQAQIDSIRAEGLGFGLQTLIP